MKDPKTKAEPLVEELRPLAMNMAAYYRKRLPESVLTEDIEAAAMVGVWDVVRLHGDAGAGIRKYAYFRIKGAILDFLRSQDWLPRKARARGEAEGRTFRQVSIERLTSDIVSSADVEREAWEQTVRERMTPHLELLPERERHIVISHYLLGDKFKDIGARLGISEPRVSQLHARAMDMLRLTVPRELLED